MRRDWTTSGPVKNLYLIIRNAWRSIHDDRARFDPTVDMKLRAVLLLAAICVAPHVAVSADDACADETCASHLNDLRGVLANAEDVADYVVRLRRELHLQPELMWTEHETSAVVKRELTAMGVSFELSLIHI